MNITLSASDFEWILPEITLAVFGLLILLAKTSRRKEAQGVAGGVLTLIGAPLPFFSRSICGACARTSSAAST